MTAEKTKYCHRCGALIDEKYPVCPACGAQQPSLPGMEASPRALGGKNPWLAALLSLLVTGLGQMYLGRWRRGLVMILGSLALGVLLEPYVTWEETIVIGATLSIVAAVDAYRIAKARG